MNSPYTPQPLDAFMAAQTSVGMVLGAVIWARVRPRAAMLLFLGAVALAVLVPVEADFLRELGATLGPDHSKNVLKVAAGLATIGALVTRQRRLIVAAIVGEIALWFITNYIQDGELELAAAHVGFFGLLIGMCRTRRKTAEVRAEPRAAAAPPLPAIDDLWTEDLAAFVIGTIAGTVSCWGLLHAQTNSADEWGNTFQAALFAKFHAYGSVPHCSEAFRNFYVFQYMGRSFAQYTPGWPLFMAPFVALHVPWLAGPASLGLLAAGVSRLTRRAAAGISPGTAPPPVAHLRAAGRFAAAAVVLSSTVLINGGSRYPHVFVAAMFAWSVEALCVVTMKEITPRDQRRWGVVLGAAMSLMVAARPGDGACLGFGLFLYFVYAVVRRRVAWRSVAATTALCVFVGGLTLVILRLQLGAWFKTAYPLGETIYPWNEAKWSLPKANEYRTALPIGTGAYCWWPCAPAIGLAGIADLRGRSRRLGFIFFFSTVPLLIFYFFFEIGRGYDFGYGPRYQLHTVVPMAVGGGVVLAHLWSRARGLLGELGESASALALGGPVAVAIAAIAIGVLRIAPLVYPYTYSDVRDHNRLHDALDQESLHHAIVMGGPGLNRTDPMDLTENLPLDLYPDQDVLIAIDRGEETEQCIRQKYRGWRLFRALPSTPVRIIKFL